MKFVRLSARCLINPSDVSDIAVNDHDFVEVRMISGAVHIAERHYREGLFAAVDRLRREIEAASDGG